MGEVIELDIPTTLPIPPKTVLQAAIDAEVSDALVIGWDTEGELWFGMAPSNRGEILLLLELAKKELLGEV